MKLVVNENCIGCGACQRESDAVYEINENGLAEVKVNPIPAELSDAAIAGKDACPVDAIQEEE